MSLGRFAINVCFSQELEIIRYRNACKFLILFTARRTLQQLSLNLFVFAIYVIREIGNEVFICITTLSKSSQLVCEYDYEWFSQPNFVFDER